MTDERVSAAVRAGGVRELDPRGLMPLAEARAILRGTRAFVKGEGHDVDGQYVLASDVVWAALLSLEDGDELVRVASALDWQFQPRGMDNVDLWRRYGDALVPWLATRVDRDGVLHNHPWCVVPCLLACEGAAAFELVMRVREVAAMARVALPTAWLDRHAEVGAACLEARGDARSRAHLAAMRARGLVAAAPAAPVALDDVLALLDACALRLVAPELGLWPSSAGTGPRRCHGLRAIAAKDGDAWGIAIERLEGDRPRGVYPARIAVHAFGPQVGGRYGVARVVPRAIELDGAPAEREAFAAWLAGRGEHAFGPARAALPALGLDADRAHVVAVIPHLAHAEPGAAPSESPVFRALARAVAEG